MELILQQLTHTKAFESCLSYILGILWSGAIAGSSVILLCTAIQRGGKTAAVAKSEEAKLSVSFSSRAVTEEKSVENLGA